MFDGKQVLEPEALEEVDTDLSSVLKINEHVETIQKIFDVVKKTAYGIDFVILGLENQKNIHYAMPLRHMLYDSLTYLKECNAIVEVNRKEKNLKSSAEFLSGLKKTDRLHPVISICVYYGEDDWDGPLCLQDMLNLSDELKPMVADYKMNLVQVKQSENYQFQNQDIATVFDMIRCIYNHNYDEINKTYVNKTMDIELALVIGSITGAVEIINEALEQEGEGKKMEMCKALQALKQQGVETGIVKGKAELLKQQVQKKLAKGKSIEVIADELEEEVADIEAVIAEIKTEE